MKFYSISLTILLVCSISLVKCADEQPPSKFVCPKEGELPAQCICYESVGYLLCENLKSFPNFSQSYHFDTMTIRNSPDMPLFSERLTLKNDFTVKSLVVLQNESVKEIRNLDQLIHYPTESIKLVGTSAQGVIMETVDLANLPRSVTSISISNINSIRYGTGLKNLFRNLPNLTDVQLNSITILDPKVNDLMIVSAHLVRIEISNTDIAGMFSLIPKKCIPHEEIHIELRNNDQLTDFDFSFLFQSDKCNYHIDLTGSKLNPKFLTLNVAKLDVVARGKFYLQLRDVELQCDCPLVKLYKEKHSANIHSVKCSNGEGKYLDQIVDCERDLKKIV